MDYCKGLVLDPKPFATLNIYLLLPHLSTLAPISSTWNAIAHPSPLLPCAPTWFNYYLTPKANSHPLSVTLSDALDLLMICIIPWSRMVYL